LGQTAGKFALEGVKMTQETVETTETVETQAPQTEDIQTGTGDVQPGEAVTDGEAAPPEAEPKKDGLQERFSELTRKARESAEDAAYWRGKAEAQTQPAPQPAQTQAPAQPVITPDMFDTDAEYHAALTQHITETVTKTINQNNQALTQQQKINKRNDQILEAVKDMPDIVNVGSGQPFMTEIMLDAADGDSFPKIFNHLGSNRAEASRIASLPPAQQAKEIGKLEVKLAAGKPPPKTKSSAPEPSPTIPTGPGSTIKDPNNMTYQEKKAVWEKQRLKDLGVET
jgi:hypothetical protein